LIVPRRKIDLAKSNWYHVLKLLYNSKSLAGEVKKWQKTFADYLGVKHAVAVASGRVGMELIIQSLNLPGGSEVIIPAYTLKDLLPIIENLNLKPVPADIGLDNFNMTVESVNTRINKNTKLILVTHMFGNPAPVAEILKIAQKKGIFVVEDCAHSVGSEIANQKTGTFGYAAFFSFEMIKPINSFGGGMIVTNSDHCANYTIDSINSWQKKDSIVVSKVFKAHLENFLFSTSLAYFYLRLLAEPKLKQTMVSLYRRIQKPPDREQKFTDIQARIALRKLATLHNRLCLKREKAQQLKNLLNQIVKCQKVSKSNLTNYYFFVCLLPGEAIKARKQLLSKGIDAGIGDEIADDCSILLGYKDCPNVREVSSRAIHLPLFGSMTKSQMEVIVRTLHKFYR
jgi:perosamine synthetase